MREELPSKQDSPHTAPHVHGESRVRRLGSDSDASMKVKHESGGKFDPEWENTVRRQEAANF